MDNLSILYVYNLLVFKIVFAVLHVYNKIIKNIRNYYYYPRTKPLKIILK
jgi:hypothetical protein